MNSSQISLILHALAPALDLSDRRPLAVVHAMERGMPGLSLAWQISDDAQAIPAPEGDDRSADGSFPLRCNANLEHLVTLSRREWPGALCSGGKPQFLVHADWPMDAPGLAAAADVLEAVAEAAGSYWAHVTPDTLTLDIAAQIHPPLAGPSKHPRGLPTLKRSSQIGSPEIPEYLGWLNYWSAAAARAIGFPDPARDAELLSRSRPTASGGWVVRLTDAPLDLDDPAHLQALLRAYERFPAIGGRASS